MDSPFLPQGNTVNIDVAATTARVQVASGQGRRQVRIMNDGTATAWFTFGGATVEAALASSIPIGPGAIEVLTVSATGDIYAAAIAAAATGKIYFTPGSGV